MIFNQTILQKKILVITLVSICALFLFAYSIRAQVAFTPRYNTPCPSGESFFNPDSNNSTPCAPLHTGYQAQAKGGSVVSGSALHVYGTTMADEIQSLTTFASPQFTSGGGVEIALCAGLSSGSISRCTAGKYIPQGKENDTLRHDGTNCASTDILSMTPTETKINYGTGTSVNTPNYPPVLGPKLVINGNIQIKGKNYKPVGDNSIRFLTDTGGGSTGWASFSEVLNKNMIRLGFRLYDSSKHIYPAQIGVLCPPDYPKAISGGGNCGGGANEFISDSSPISIRCQRFDSCRYAGDFPGNTYSSSSNPYNYDYVGYYAPISNHSGDINLEDSDGWSINCNTGKSSAEVYAVCSK